MNKLKNLIFISSLVLSAGIVLIAYGLTVYIPHGVHEKRLIIILLLVLAPMPVVISYIISRAIRAYSGEVEQYATRDPLTNLYNQTTFRDLLGYETDRATRQNYRFSLMVIDIDDFKAINDMWGHEVGDKVLMEFSNLFRAAIRKGDIPARYGGDNFTAILPVCDEAQAYIVAKRLLDSLREHAYNMPDGSPVRITASIGIAVYPDHARDAKDLFLLADSLLMQAKSAGKDRLSVPSDEMDLDNLRSAGEKNIIIMEAIRDRRIVPYFQPIMCVKEQSVLAYEVLTRIITPERVIPAADFIEAAEGMGAIGKINYMLIDGALFKMQQLGYKGTLFFNLSPKALVLSEFIPTVRRLLKTYGISPSQIVFEITERDTVKNLGLIESYVRELREEGFRFAIDDFGAGYSSLQYLRMFDVDFLKVDGEFIRNMAGGNGVERAIVSNIAALAGELGIKTIAEYVETEAILGNVRSAGVDYAQGYHIQRPSPEFELTGPLILGKKTP